ncbi:hypothetical protein BDZ90DRAFT_226937, partial [Jaminaea rosea]
MSFGSTTVFLPMSYEVAHFVQGEVWVEIFDQREISIDTLVIHIEPTNGIPPDKPDISIDDIKRDLAEWYRGEKRSRRFPNLDEQFLDERIKRLDPAHRHDKPGDHHWLHVEDAWPLANVYTRPVELYNRVLGPRGSCTVVPSRISTSLEKLPDSIVLAYDKEGHFDSGLPSAVPKPPIKTHVLGSKVHDWTSTNSHLVLHQLRAFEHGGPSSLDGPSFPVQQQPDSGSFAARPDRLPDALIADCNEKGNKGGNRALTMFVELRHWLVSDPPASTSLACCDSSTTPLTQPTIDKTSVRFNIRDGALYNVAFETPVEVPGPDQVQLFSVPIHRTVMQSPRVAAQAATLHAAPTHRAPLAPSPVANSAQPPLLASGGQSSGIRTIATKKRASDAAREARLNRIKAEEAASEEEAAWIDEEEDDDDDKGAASPARKAVKRARSISPPPAPKYDPVPDDQPSDPFDAEAPRYDPVPDDPPTDPVEEERESKVEEEEDDEAVWVDADDWPASLRDAEEDKRAEVEDAEEDADGAPPPSSPTISQPSSALPASLAVNPLSEDDSSESDGTKRLVRRFLDRCRREAARAPSASTRPQRSHVRNQRQRKGEGPLYGHDPRPRWAKDEGSANARGHLQGPPRRHLAEFLCQARGQGVVGGGSSLRKDYKLKTLLDDAEAEVQALNTWSHCLLKTGKVLPNAIIRALSSVLAPGQVEVTAILVQRFLPAVALTLVSSTNADHQGDAHDRHGAYDQQHDAADDQAVPEAAAFPSSWSAIWILFSSQEAKTQPNVAQSELSTQRQQQHDQQRQQQHDQQRQQQRGQQRDQPPQNRGQHVHRHQQQQDRKQHQQPEHNAGDADAAEWAEWAAVHDAIFDEWAAQQAMGHEALCGEWAAEQAAIYESNKKAQAEEPNERAREECATRFGKGAGGAGGDDGDEDDEDEDDDIIHPQDVVNITGSPADDAAYLALHDIRPVKVAEDGDCAYAAILIGLGIKVTLDNITGLCRELYDFFKSRKARRMLEGYSSDIFAELLDSSIVPEDVRARATAAKRALPSRYWMSGLALPGLAIIKKVPVGCYRADHSASMSYCVLPFEYEGGPAVRILFDGKQHFLGVERTTSRRLPVARTLALGKEAAAHAESDPHARMHGAFQLETVLGKAEAEAQGLETWCHCLAKTGKVESGEPIEIRSSGSKREGESEKRRRLSEMGTAQEKDERDDSAVDLAPAAKRKVLAAG